MKITLRRSTTRTHQGHVYEGSENGTDDLSNSAHAVAVEGNNLTLRHVKDATLI